MTDKEAMKLALDALKNHSGNYKLSMAEVFGQEVAITALEEALAEHAMSEVQRLGQEIEPMVDYIAARDMLDAQPVPPRTRGVM